MANREKMDRAERAKQFMPFAALRGLEEALRAKERANAKQQEFPGQNSQAHRGKQRQAHKNKLTK